MADLNNKYDIPCEKCMHTQVCGLKFKLADTKVTSEHPYVTVNIGCEQYRPFTIKKEVNV